jgi:hypothetical protein
VSSSTGTAAFASGDTATNIVLISGMVITSQERIELIENLFERPKCTFRYSIH